MKKIDLTKQSRKTHYRSSVLKERVSVIIERDLCLILVAWLLLSKGKGIPEHSILPLITSICVVAAAEIVNAIVRRVEPDAASAFKIKSEDDAYDAGIDTYIEDGEIHEASYSYEDAADVDDEDEDEEDDNEPISDYVDLAFSIASEKIHKKLKLSPKSIGRDKSGSELTFKITIAIIAVFVIIATSILDFDPDTDYYNDFDYSDSAFYTESGYLDDVCKEAVNKLAEGDVDYLQWIGDGDYTALINAMDWSSAELEEEARDINMQDEEEALIRYRAVTSDGEFMVGFKFRGDGMSYDESNANLVGIAVCPMDPWNEYDRSDTSDDDYDDMWNSVEDLTISIGDIDYYDSSILLW